VLAIGLDQTAAVPVDAPAATAWATRLSAEGSIVGPPAVSGVAAALGPADRIALRERPPGSVLVRTTPDGEEIPVGGTAVGTGHVLVQHRRSVNEPGITLSAVTLATGRVTGSLAVGSRVERAADGPDGTTAVATREVFAVLHTDGRVSRLDIGAADFLGEPS
jgi:hypothetical protein